MDPSPEEHRTWTGWTFFSCEYLMRVAGSVHFDVCKFLQHEPCLPYPVSQNCTDKQIGSLT